MSVPPLDVSLLEIVGYADVVPRRALPSIVPPVFRRKDNPASFLVPPYSFSNGRYLCDATEISLSELESLVHQQEVTLFLDAPKDAQKEFELWLDDQGELHYDPRRIARENLNRIALSSLRGAEQAFLARQLDQAEQHSSVALLADGGSADAWAVKLAIAKAAEEADSVELLGELLPHNMISVVHTRVAELLRLYTRNSGMNGTSKLSGIAHPQYKAAA